MIKKLTYCLFVIAVVALLTMGFSSHAEEELPSPDGYVEQILDELPSEIRSQLPQADTYDELVSCIDSSYLLSLSLSFLKNSLNSVTSHLVFFLATLVISALAERIESAFGKKESSISLYLSVLLIAYKSFSIVYTLFQEVSVFCQKVNAYMLTFTGVMSAVTFLGGGTMLSTTNSTSLSLTVSLLGSACTFLLLPIIKISFATAVTSSASNRINLSSLSGFIRGMFTFLIGIVSIISIVAITFQTMLAQAEDTLAARSIRFAASSSIPIVGNAVGDSVRTMGAAVAVIQKSVGMVGVVALVIMTLYPLSVLFSAKIAFSLSQTLAKLLDVASAEKLLAEVSQLINMLMATISIISVLYIFVTGIFTGSTILAS